MTPLLAALSSRREAVRSWDWAVAVSPLSAASRNLRTAVLSSDFTALLRRRRRSFCPIRLIWDLMLATPDLPQVSRVGYQPSRLPVAQLQPVRSRSQRRATSPWAAWKPRTVGSPGGAGRREGPGGGPATGPPGAGAAPRA